MADAQPYPDEVLMAFADGELDDATREAVAEAARSDAAVAARIAAFRASGEAAREAFAGIISAPVPQRLVGAATCPPASNVVPFPARRFGRAATLAMAASVAGVAVLGGYLAGQRSGAPGLLATGPELVAALDTQPSGAALGGGTRVTGSYAVPDGVCRSFERSDEGLRGLACKRGATWQVEMAVAASGGITPASDRAGAVLDATLDALGASAPLSAEEEAALRGRQWTP
ncbi:hypothetical protein [Falsiroseomonas sp. E2-1-a20]|uniref:hypothetical protein n=1 Tax=Falsiroseomonas sp. E2-1-a20 TaxID=3239300 RepID=UPI003F3A158F